MYGKFPYVAPFWPLPMSNLTKPAKYNILHGEEPTIVSSPSVNSIKKNIMDQNAAPGIRAKASGYATKAKPGPEE